MAGDAPITAVTARRFGPTVHLVSNRVSLDPAGQAVLDVLDTAAVTHQAVPTVAPGSGTPQLTIVTDEAGTRTWFAWLGTAVEHLSIVDLSPLTVARLAYIHGAGAAFSGGLAHAYLAGATVRQAVHAGCVAGTTYCTATARYPTSAPTPI